MTSTPSTESKARTKGGKNKPEATESKPVNGESRGFNLLPSRPEARSDNQPISDAAPVEDLFEPRITAASDKDRQPDSLKSGKNEALILLLLNDIRHILEEIERHMAENNESVKSPAP